MEALASVFAIDVLAYAVMDEEERGELMPPVAAQRRGKKGSEGKQEGQGDSEAATVGAVNAKPNKAAQRSKPVKRVSREVGWPRYRSLECWPVIRRSADRGVEPATRGS